jgi:hypothetical protein
MLPIVIPFDSLRIPLSRIAARGWAILIASHHVLRESVEGVATVLIQLSKFLNLSINGGSFVRFLRIGQSDSVFETKAVWLGKW